MRYHQLSNTDVQVSELCLGTMTFGEQNTEQEGFDQLDMAVDHGINFIDTAEMYPVPPRAETMGRTETIIGNWLARRKRRDDVIIATKVAGPGRDWLKYIRGGANRLDRDNIRQAVSASLQRLQTDVIDVYQLHWPDRETNCFGKLGYVHPEDDASVPLLETLQVLAELVDEGKIRHVGVSNETPWGVMRLVQMSAEHGLPRPVSIQNPYNLLNRTFEIGLAEIAHRESVGLLAYSPMAFGVLSGKYLAGQRPPGSRLVRFPGYDRYSNVQAQKASHDYVTLARDYGIDPAQMALAYVNSRPFVTSNIIGATSTSQLRSNLKSVDLALGAELLGEIEEIHRRHPNPSP
ncbi:MAG: NADP(H)-dependent aldo-keto reductase [Gammaproteobacteria bacterium]|nr:NADP(H)-dependent aldo-keto reductase [Gammaproteobacteria bacterium]